MRDSSPPSSPLPGERVVLLHGIFRTHRHMRKLARYLEQQGYSVLNLYYPSTRYPLEGLAQWIHPQIEAFAQGGERIHFVGYSMGGLLIRAYLAQHRPANLGRVVMIGTPNQGSEVADFLCRGKWRGELYRRLYGPAGQQLITTQHSFGQLFAPVDYELGIIAGDRPVDLISSHIIGQPNDGKVAVERTKLAGMRDHLVLHTNHTTFPQQPEVWAQTAHFLRFGQFKHAG